MLRFVKIILLLLFAVVAQGIAYNLSTDVTDVADACDFVFATSPEEVSSAQLPYLPEGELSGETHSNQVLNSRIQRINLLEYTLSLKSLVLKLSSLQAALEQHQRRIYDTSASYRCHPSSRYYVFALRRIII